MHPADVRDVREDVWGRHEALRTSCFISHGRNETNLVPMAFTLKKLGGAGRPIFFKGKALGTRLKRETTWPIADQRVPCNDPRINCGTHFGTSSRLVSKVANCVMGL